MSLSLTPEAKMLLDAALNIGPFYSPENVTETVEILTGKERGVINEVWNELVNRPCRNPTNKEQVRLAILAALYAIILNLISLFWAFVFIDLISSPIVFLITKNIVSTLDL